MALVNRLSVSSFFHFHILQPKELPKKDRCTALALSILLGVLTAGLCHLIVRFALYNRNFTKINSSAVANTAQNALGTVSNAVKPLPPVFHLPDVVVKCNVGKSFEERLKEKNREIADSFLKMNPNDLDELLAKRFAKLSDRSKGEVRQIFSDWKRNQQPNGLASQDLTERMFWIDQMTKFKDKGPTNYGLVPVGCGSPQHHLGWFRMLGLLSNHVKSPFGRPLEVLMPQDKFISDALPQAFNHQTAEEITEEEYSFLKTYLEERVQVLNQEMQFATRKVQSGIFNAYRLPVEVLTLPLEETSIRCALSTDEELQELTVGCAQNFTQLELKYIGKRLDALDKKDAKHQKLGVDTSSLTLGQIRWGRGVELEMHLTCLPKNLFTFVVNVHELPLKAIEDNFENFFPKVNMRDRQQDKRFRNLTVDQINKLLPKFDDFMFANLTEQQVAGLDVSLLRADFQRLFPKSHFPAPSSDAIHRLGAPMLEQLIDLLDENRLSSLDFDILKQIDKTKWSAQQRQIINRFKINGLTL